MPTPTPPREPLPVISWAQLLALFDDPSTQAKLREKIRADGVEGLAVMRDAEIYSRPGGGHHVAFQYGPGCTVKAADLYLHRPVPSPAGGSRVYSLVSRCPRAEAEVTDDIRTLPGAGVVIATVPDSAERIRGTPIDHVAECVGGVEVRRAWPTLYKKTTGSKTQEWEIWVERVDPDGFGRIHTRYGLADGKKQEQQDVVTAGKNLGKKNATTAYEQAVAEAQAEWTKQLERKGYGRDVEASAEVRGSSPMLAHPLDKVKPAEIDWATAFAQPKLDGFRCLAVRDGAAVRLRSRENKPIATMGHIAAALLPHLPEGVTLDGELYVHGTEFQKIASLVKREQPGSARVEYHVYDALLPDPFDLRRNLVRTVVNAAQSRVVVGVRTDVVRSHDDLMAYQGARIAEGYEGAMLRHTAAGYEAGKRSKTLLKVKTFRDEEFVVAQVREGRGTHKGMAIFLCRTAAGAEFEVTAPGGHWEKRQYWLNRAACVGAALTVKFFELTDGANPVPRFPVGLRFKDEPFEMPAAPPEPAAD